MRRYLFLFLCVAWPSLLFPAGPNLIWSQTYGESPYAQQFNHIALDGSDNLYVGGYVYLGTYGNALENKYGPLGTMIYNRMYVNNYTDTLSDAPVALFPDDEGGVTVFGYINRLHQLLHTYYYDTDGNLLSDYFLGDTTLGNTRPFKVITAGDTVFYVLGELNGAGTLLKCNSQDSVYWSQPLHNNYNISAGNIRFDAYGNIVVAVFDSLSPELFVRRFNAENGHILGSFDTHIDSFPQNDSMIVMGIDNYDGVIINALTSGNGYYQQRVVKFDTLGNMLWSAICTSPKGYFRSSSTAVLRLDSRGDAVLNGLYQDYADTSQFAAIYKLSNDSGELVWMAIDSGNYVQGTALGLDPDDNVYTGTLKAYASTAAYSLLWFNSYIASTGALNWTRSFDNGAENANINIAVNYAGDVFFATNEKSDTDVVWFVGRVGNAAGDAGIEAVSADIENMHVFPNPSRGSNHVAFSLPQNEKLRFRVFDMMGNILYDEELNGVSGQNLLTYNGRLAAGMYFFQLSDAEGIECRKAVMY